MSTKGILITLSGCLSLGTARAGDDALGELLKRYKGAEVSPKAAKASPSAKPKAAKLNMTKKSVVKGAELARSPASEPKVAAEPQSSKTESEAETASGGLLGQLDLKGEFDFEKIANLKGLSLRLYGLGNHGSQPTDYVGDTGGTSTTAGYLLIWELGWAGATDDIPYKFALGAWTYTERQAALDSSKEDSYNWGSYALVNHKLADRTAGFLRYGLSSLRVNQISQSLEVGATYQGLVGARPDDLVGLGAALAAASADAKTDGSSSCETAIEAFYRAEMGHGIALTPDLQYVIRPSFDPALANAFVGSLRVEIGF